MQLPSHEELDDAIRTMMLEGEKFFSEQQFQALGDIMFRCHMVENMYRMLKDTHPDLPNQIVSAILHGIIIGLFVSDERQKKENVPIGDTSVDSLKKLYERS